MDVVTEQHFAAFTPRPRCLDMVFMLNATCDSRGCFIHSVLVATVVEENGRRKRKAAYSACA